MSLAESIYSGTIERKKFFDSQAARIMRQVEVERHAVYIQAKTLFVPHTHPDIYLKLLPAALIHVIKLIKNILVLASVTLLCLLALFSDRAIAAKLSLAMAIETFLIFANISNIMLAVISPVTTGVASIAGLFSNRDNPEANQLNHDNDCLNEKKRHLVYDGFFTKAEDSGARMYTYTFESLYKPSYLT